MNCTKVEENFVKWAMLSEGQITTSLDTHKLLMIDSTGFNKNSLSHFNIFVNQTEVKHSVKIMYNTCVFNTLAMFFHHHEHSEEALRNPWMLGTKF